MLKKITLLLVLLAILGAQTLQSKEKHLPLDLAVLHNNQGVTYLSQNNLDLAEVEFKSAVELDPKYPEAHNNLGLIYKYKGYFDKANDEFNTAIKLKPKWATPYNHIATVYLSMEKYDKAISYTKKAVSLDKKFADAYYNMGLIYLEKAKHSGNPRNEWADAVDAFQKATTIDTRLYHAHLDLADTYVLQGETEKAIIRYRYAIETNPKDPDTWQRLGELYQKTGDTEKAQECFNKVKLLEPMTEKQLLEKGEQRVKEGKFSDAFQLYNRALEMNPRSFEAHFNTGFLFSIQGLHEQAIQAYKNALSIKPDSMTASFNMGLAFIAIKDYPSAIRTFEYILKLYPNHSEAKYQLGKLYQQTGNGLAARTVYCNFLMTAESDQSKERFSEVQKEATSLGGCQASSKNDTIIQAKPLPPGLNKPMDLHDMDKAQDESYNLDNTRPKGKPE